MLAIDLCAGSGWAVACTRLGIDEQGVEIMPEALATREAMGALSYAISISDLPDAFCSQAPLQIAGPPCQTFSGAGKGEGRKALTEVLRRVSVFGSTGTFIRGGSGDPRTWLVLEPLRLAIGGMPMFLVWEQVPSVLPVWEACAEVLRSVGYSVWTGISYSEQYGVPQARRRAKLIARRDGKVAAMPVPTHSRYYERTPERLDDGVLPWVSMGEVLDLDDFVGFPRKADEGASIVMNGEAYRARDMHPTSRPSANLTEKARSWVDVNGNQANSARRELSQPAPTVHFGERVNAVNWEYVSSTMPNSARRPATSPAPTIAFGHDANSARWVSDTFTRRVTVQEAAILQTFPADHPFRGSMTKQYLQIGNAVPPLLAEAILRTFL